MLITARLRTAKEAYRQVCLIVTLSPSLGPKLTFYSALLLASTIICPSLSVITAGPAKEEVASATWSRSTTAVGEQELEKTGLLVWVSLAACQR